MAAGALLLMLALPNYAGIPPLQILDMHFRGVDGAFIRKALKESRRQLTPAEILDLHAKGGIVS